MGPQRKSVRAEGPARCPRAEGSAICIAQANGLVNRAAAQNVRAEGPARCPRAEGSAICIAQAIGLVNRAAAQNVRAEGPAVGKRRANYRAFGPRLGGNSCGTPGPPGRWPGLCKSPDLRSSIGVDLRRTPAPRPMAWAVQIAGPLVLDSGEFVWDAWPPQAVGLGYANCRTFGPLLG
ncbi:hypothetical protein CA51_15330 [Rosistilla oblonga]|nr:hypothetical protein CA51_15330 [Rosistilla oblonga]